MLHRLLQHTLDEEPDRQILEFHGQFWTAAELEQAASRLAAHLMQAGLQPIDRVAMLLPNSVEAIIAYLACFKANFVIVPLDYRHQPAQIGYSLNHSGADVFIVHHRRLAELEQEGVLSGLSNTLVVGGNPSGARQRRFEDYTSREVSVTFPEEFEDNDLCVMIYTSGTTSRPKGVTLTRSAMIEGIRKYVAWVTLDKEDTALIAAPITRPMALRSQLLPVLYVGGCVSLLERFTVDTYVSALKRPPNKTFIALLPAALRQVLNHPDTEFCDFSSLRLCMSGGDSVPMKLHDECLRVTGVPITEQCGASEVGPYALNPPFGNKKPGSIGLPMYGVQVCVVDERGDDARTNQVGEILVNSPMMMDGYWNDTAMTRKTIQDGWVRTGDLGRFDEDGFLWFMGRKKDVIIRGGSNISPLEVESALLGNDDVMETCVVGLVDPDWGQVVHAFVVLAPDSPLTEEELLDFAKEKLSAYMVPDRIHFIDALPVKGPGKLDRDLLRMRAQIRPLMDKVAFFRNASEEFVRDIVPRLEIQEFGAGYTVFRQGDVGDAMYFLTSGQVELILEDTGKQLGVLSEGAYFGELAVLMEAPRSATAQMLNDCEVYELRRKGVLELAEQYPDFASYLEEARASYQEV